MDIVSSYLIPLLINGDDTSILGPTLGRWVVNIFIWLLYWGRSVRHCVAKLFGWMKSERMISSEDGSLAGAGTAYAIMFWQGLGNLFPWNAFITAAHYFAMRFCGTSFEETFESYFSAAFTLAQTIGLALAIRYQDRLPLKFRILGPLTLNASIFVLTTILVTITVDSYLLFAITLLSCCIVGSSNALLSGGIFGLAGTFPPNYTGAVMSGQGLAGLVVSVASLVTIWAGKSVDMCTDDDAADDDGDCDSYVDYSALSFFIISCVVMGSCVFSFIALLALPFTHYYQNKTLEDMKRGPSIVADDKNETGPPTETEALLEDLLESSGTEQVVYEVTPERVWRIFNQIKPAAAGAYLTFAVTLALFPSITVLIESSQQCSSNASRFNNDLFIPFMFLLFNLFDFIGRVFAGVNQLGLTPNTVWIAVACRVIFIPLFLFCNVSGSQLPVLFGSDAFPIIFMILFALSNGYLSTLSMMFGPTMVSTRHSNLAGTIMVFCLTFGLMSGSVLSFLMLLISQGSL